jgi:septum site-determining protein MinC
MNYSKIEAFKLRMRSVTLPVLQILDANPELIEQQLEELKNKTPNLFQSTPMIVDIDLLVQNGEDTDWKSLIALLRHYGILPVGLQGGCSSVLKDSLSELGVATFNADKINSSDKESQRGIPTSTKKTFAHQAEAKLSLSKIISRPVRSGQQVYAEGGDLIVLSSVSPGAELLADGNIHVYGPLRGRALAGIQGNREARIFCQQLDADLVAIAGCYMTSDVIDRYRVEGGQQVALDDGRLVITSL